MSKTQLWCLVAGAVFSQALFAQQAATPEQRWFEVEIIVFSQQPAANLQERFADSTTPIKPGRAIDLLTPHYQRDISKLLATLAPCQLPSPAQLTEGFTEGFTPAFVNELCIIEPQPPVWAHSNLFEALQLNSTVPFPAQLSPLVVGSGVHQDSPYLTDASALQLDKIAARIARQSDKQLLLHTAWRQAPVTERLAVASRWYSGNNYSAEFDYWGQPLVKAAPAPEQASSIDTELTEPDSDTQQPAGNNDMLQHIEQLLQLLTAEQALPERASTDTAEHSATDDSAITINTLPQQVWQLDGLFKLHLDHYLFVNTEFNLRLPQADKLQSIYVKQSRRVISGEVHYLDHPYLGIVLQIRRFEPTLPPPDEENVTEDLPEQP